MIKLLQLARLVLSIGAVAGIAMTTPAFAQSNDWKKVWDATLAAANKEGDRKSVV